MERAIASEATRWQSFLGKLEKLNPVLANHLLEWQSRSLSDYSDYLWHGLRRGGGDARLAEFASACETACVHRYGTGFGLSQQLRATPVVLSAHHTAPIFHPIAFQSLLVAVAARKPPQTVPVLSSDWVPMDNSFYPRGLLLPGCDGLVSINLFGKCRKNDMVSLQSAFGEEEIEKALKTIAHYVAEGLVSEDVAEYHSYILDVYYRDAFVLAQNNYSSQCSVLNFSFCKALFPDIDFAFINVSEIVSALLIKELENESSLLFRLLFYPGFRIDLIRALDGVSGCWDIKRKQGSILFWKVNKGRMEPFFYHTDDTLYSKSGRLSLDPNSVISAIARGEIIPGMSLVFSMLMFSYGISCVGGMLQILYANDICSAVSAVAARCSAAERGRIEAQSCDMIVAGMYAAMNSTGNPLCLAECMFTREFSRAQLKHRSLVRAVLDASDDLLSLSPDMSLVGNKSGA